jgi:hypothetical protein
MSSDSTIQKRFESNGTELQQGRTCKLACQLPTWRYVKARPQPLGQSPLHPHQPTKLTWTGRSLNEKQLLPDWDWIQLSIIYPTKISTSSSIRSAKSKLCVVMVGSKSRPESSLSHVDDIWSESGRPFSSDATTDDSSWDAVQSRGSPQIDESLKDVQNQLESRLQAITESSTEAEDLKVEKEHMQHQLKLVQNQMRRLIDARARGDTDVDLVHFEPVIYTARQLRLIRKV